MARNLITISFGEDINDNLFELNVRKEVGSSEFIKKKVKLSDAVAECFDQIISTYAAKKMNPLYQLGILTLRTNLTSYQRQVADNCLTLRNFIGTYIRDRKSGKCESKVKNKSDLLSLFFENTEIFTEEFMIDELIDFLFAGTATT